MLWDLGPLALSSDEGYVGMVSFSRQTAMFGCIFISTVLYCSAFNGDVQLTQESQSKHDAHEMVLLKSPPTK